MISFNWNKAFNHCRLLLVSFYCCLSFAVWNPCSIIIEAAVLRLSKRLKPIEVWTRLGSAALTALTKSYLDSLWRRGPLKVPVWNTRVVKCSTNWGANQANKQTNKTATLFRDIRIFFFPFSLFVFCFFRRIISINIQEIVNYVNDVIAKHKFKRITLLCLALNVNFALWGIHI